MFDEATLLKLQRAAEEIAWLVGRDYAEEAAIAFVGAHHDLGPEARLIVAQGTCSDAQYKHRALRELDAEDLAKRPLRLDASGVLSTVEALLAGRPVLASLDGTLSDPAFDRRSYRPTAEVDAAIERVFALVAPLRPSALRAFVSAADDALAARLEAHVKALKRVPLEIKRVESVVDALRSGAHVATPDPAILDVCASWFNVSARIAEGIPNLRVVRLQG